MDGYTFRLAQKTDTEAVVQFITLHWGARTPLIHHPDFFAYYYKDENSTLRFALAEQNGAICALAGYIPANSTPTPDIWVSIWVADKKAKGSGLELMAELPRLLNCRVLACNNIRANTRPFYEFLGYTTGQMNHYYRLADKTSYSLAVIANKHILPANGNAHLKKIKTELALQNSGFIPNANARPYKDIAYIQRRYFQYPHQTYTVFGIYIADNIIIPSGLLIARIIHTEKTTVLRISDFIGCPSLLAECGNAINNLLLQAKAEYADIYCAGIPEAILNTAGFICRGEQDPNIIPNYLEPPLIENTEYYYFTNLPDGFTMFKADGDQDRPNINF